MANRLKGITLEIGGDTTELSKSLSGVNKDIRDTQAQLKDVQKLLKLDPTNVDLLRQKQKLLTEQVKNTKTKLDELKKAQENMDSRGVDKNSEQYRNLQREIISVENELRDLEKAAAKSNVALEAIGAAANKVAAGANKVASATRGMSAAAAAGLAAIGGLAISSLSAADDLNTLAQQTGFTVEELQKMQYASEQIDVEFTAFTSSATALRKAMKSGSDAFEALGVSIYDVNGKLRDSTEVYWEVVEALGRIENGTERDVYAMTLFGRSADQLAGLVDDGAAKFRLLGDEADRAGLIMSGETVTGLAAINEELDKLKATAKATLAQAGAKAVQALAPVLEQIVNIIAAILDYIGSLDSSQIRMLVTIMAIVAVIAPMAGIIAGIASAVLGLSKVVMALNAAILANPYILVIAGITVAIIALAALIWAFWDDITARWDRLVARIKQGRDQLQALATGAIKMLHDVLTLAGQTLLNTLRNLANAVVSVIEHAINATIDRINAVIDAVSELVGWLASLVGLSFGGFSGFERVSLPKFAKGGSIGQGTALVGEAGPELLTVAGGRATVQPLTATIDPKSLSGLGGGSNVVGVTVNFTGSLAQLASVLQPEIQAETTRRGPALVT